MSPDPTHVLSGRTYYFDDAMVSLTAYLRECVIADLEGAAALVRLPGDARRWYDVRPMVDPALHDPLVIEMHERALDVGLAFLVLHQHTEMGYLVRLDQPAGPLAS